MVVDMMVAQELSTLSKAFLHQITHAYNLRSRLAAQVYDTARGMTVSQEIVEKEYAVVLRQELAVDAHRRLTVSRE